MRTGIGAIIGALIVFFSMRQCEQPQEVVETRDTIYKCPLNMNSYTVQYFNTSDEIENHIRPNNCTLDKIVTTRRYKLYIINEYGQKEYLSMELSKTK